jgi:serine/threonine protein kinase
MGIQNLVGQTLGQYELRALIGMGGMGAVYRGYQANLKREVAVKVLAAQLVQQPGYLERFNREAETAAALEHRHIIPIYDYGMQSGVSYVVMRLLTGGTLADRLMQHTQEAKPLPSLGEISKVLEQLASALDYAHSRGVIHRDIKPSNVMFDNQGSAYLVDFGIAKLMEATHALTGTGTTMGTPSYMSPEQWKAEALTPAADQYALGVLVYSLVAGRVPFEAPTPYGLMHKHLNEMPTPPQVVRPDAPQAVTDVINRALAKTADERFPTCTAFAQAFDGAIRGNTGEATNFFAGSLPPKPDMASRAFSTQATVLPGTRPARTPRPIYSNPVVFVVALAAVIALGVAIAWWASNRENDSHGAGVTATVTSPVPVIVILDTPTSAPPPTEVSPDQTNTAPVPSETASSTPSVTPSATNTPVPSDTPDLEGTANAMLAERLTQTATMWTDTPTPDIEASVVAAMTGTAVSWTVTPSPTRTQTSTPTLTSTATTTPTFTLIPTQTASYTLPPTATPIPRLTNTSTPRPSNTPVPYLHVGGRAQVYVEDEGLKLRAGPGTSYEILENMPRGTIVTLIGDPKSVQGYTWWRVRSPNGREGWVVAFADELQTLIPLPD